MTTKDKEIKLTARQKQTRKQYAKLKSDVPEGHPIPSAKLRFPVIPKDIEYIDIINNKITLKSYKNEIAGMDWRKFNEKLFEDGVPAGRYSYGLKFKNNAYIYRGFIKSVDTKGTKVIDGEPKALMEIKNTIDGLKDSLRSSSPGNIGIEFILNATQKAHESEIMIYKTENNNLKEKIKELKDEITSMDKQLDEAETIINQFKSNTSNDKLSELVLGFLQSLKSGSTNPTNQTT